MTSVVLPVDHVLDGVQFLFNICMHSLFLSGSGLGTLLLMGCVLFQLLHKITQLKLLVGCFTYWGQSICLSQALHSLGSGLYMMALWGVNQGHRNTAGSRECRPVTV